MKTLSKYKNFLSDKQLYSQNQVFWKHTLSSVTTAKSEDWVITQFANGEDFFDGNPIASALYPQLDKAIRIIQVAVDKYTPILRLWIENVECNGRDIKELVVAIQPVDQAYIHTSNVFSFFLTETNKKLLHRYVHAWNTFYRSAATIYTVNPSNEPYIASKTIKEIYQKTSTQRASSGKISQTPEAEKR